MILFRAIGRRLVLRLRGEQMETLWDSVLPVEMLALPRDLARLDELCDDADLLAPFHALWRERWPDAIGHGRPTVAMETFLRLMLVKHRYGWGYQTLCREVSDSISLRRFCRISLDRSVPDESTIRKLVRRLGEEQVCEISRLVIAKVTREIRFRGRALRIDSTVVEAAVRYPTDAGLALDGARALTGTRPGIRAGDVSRTSCAMLRTRACASPRLSRGVGLQGVADQGGSLSFWGRMPTDFVGAPVGAHHVQTRHVRHT
jgi:transposase, IS5 family